MPKLFKPLACFVFIFYFLACSKKDLAPKPAPPNPPEVTDTTKPVHVDSNIVSSVYIRVQGHIKMYYTNNYYGTNFKISSGGKTTVANSHGNFYLEGVQVINNLGILRVESDGYMPTYRTFRVVDTSAVKYLEITLADNFIPTKFDPTKGGTVTTYYGPVITFLPNQILTADNTVYKGMVTVGNYAYDTYRSNFYDLYLDDWPGFQRGITKGNKEVGLRSWLTVQVSLTGASGEALHIDTSGGKTITVSTAAPPNCPVTLPVWYLDEKTGLWKEETTALLNAGNLVFNTQQCSYWSFDEPVDEKEIEVKGVCIDTSLAMPWANKKFKVTLSDGRIKYFTTNSTGAFSVNVPANATSTISIIPVACNFYSPDNPVDYLTVNAASSNINLGLINIKNKYNNHVVFSGEVTDCSWEPLMQGKIEAMIDTLHYEYPVKNGRYSISLARCDNFDWLSVYAVSADGRSSQVYSFKEGAANSQDLNVCGLTPGQFIKYSYKGTNSLLTVPQDSIRLSLYSDTYSLMAGHRWSGGPLTYIDFGKTMPANAGDYIVKGDFYFPPDDWRTDSLKCHVTKPGKTGEYMEASFKAIFHNSLSPQDTAYIEGSFRMKVQ